MKWIRSGSVKLQRVYAWILVCFFWQTGVVSLAWAGSIQDMINAASNGGTITIGIGIFNETLVVDKDLTLKGVSTSTTILKPGSAGGRVITVTAGHNLTLKDLKITNGQAQSSAGGGILVNDGSLKLIGVHITNNSAMYGGGVFQESDSGGVEVIDSLIQENSADIHGGGMYIRGSAALTNTQVISNIAGNHGGGLHVDIGSTDISGGIFNGNHTGNGNGGGINVNNQLTITGTEFFENTAGDSGGALTQWNKGYSVSITGASFENNSCKNKGGAALINSSLNLTNSTLTGNMADSGGSGNTYGGGIYTSSPAIVSSSIFTDNQAKCTGCAINGGGGLWVDRPPADLSVSTVNDSTFDGNKGWFGGGLSTSYGTLDISRTVFTNNSGGYGGGIYAYVTNGDHLLFKNNTATNKGGGLSAYSAVISNSRFMTNSAGGGGGVSAENGNLSIINVLLAENSASFLGGGAILIKNLPATISHTTIARPARGSGSGIKIEDGASLTLKNSITTNYATGLEVSAGSLTENYNLFFDNGSNVSTLNGGTITSGGNSLSGLSPLLANPAGGDYHLTSLSPAIGAGTNLGIIVDLDEHPRLNSRFDIGAYQFSHLGDIDHDGIVGLKDLLLGLHILAGIPIGVPVYSDSDTDGDMKIGLPEVIYALQRVAGLR